MDLNKLQTKDTFTVEIEHPTTGEPLGISITVYGSDSKKYKAVQHRITNENLGKRGAKANAERWAHNARIIVAECTKEWSGVEENKKVLECTFENAVDIYTKYPWLYEQVEAAIQNRANFL